MIRELEQRVYEDLRNKGYHINCKLNLPKKEVKSYLFENVLVFIFLNIIGCVILYFVL